MTSTPADHLRAVHRRIDTTERNGTEVKRLTATRTYPADLDEVWDALTTPGRISRWFTPVSGDLRLGGRYRLQGNASGEILECEPPRHLAITWEYAEEISWVDVRLTSLADQTRLELVHLAPVDPTKWAEFGPGAVGIGWEMALMGLATHLATGDAADPAAAAAWMGSPDGIAFMTGSSIAWGEASSAAGEDPEHARAAAARCTAAYTAPPEG
jgi:uncharacterized protein YndB with AHSA1/START domain